MRSLPRVFIALVTLLCPSDASFSDILQHVVSSCDSFGLCIRAIGDLAADMPQAQLDIPLPHQEAWDQSLHSKPDSDGVSKQAVSRPVQNFLSSWNQLVGSPILFDWFRQWYSDKFWLLMFSDESYRYLSDLHDRLSLSPSITQVRANLQTPIEGFFSCAIVDTFFEKIRRLQCKAFAGSEGTCSSQKVKDSVNSDMLLTVGLVWGSDASTINTLLPSINTRNVESFISRFPSVCSMYNFVVKYMQSPFVPWSVISEPSTIIDALISHSSPIDEETLVYIRNSCLASPIAITASTAACYKEHDQLVSWLVTREPDQWKTERSVFINSLSQIDPFFNRVVVYIDTLIPARPRIHYLFSKDPDMKEIFDPSTSDLFLQKFGDDRASATLPDELSGWVETFITSLPRSSEADLVNLRFELCINSARMVPVFMNPSLFGDLVTDLFGHPLAPNELDRWKTARSLWTAQQVYARILETNRLNPDYVVNVLNGMTNSIPPETQRRIPFYIALNDLLAVPDNLSPPPKIETPRPEVLQSVPPHWFPPSSIWPPPDQEDVWEYIPLTPPLKLPLSPKKSAGPTCSGNKEQDCENLRRRMEEFTISKTTWLKWLGYKFAHFILPILSRLPFGAGDLFHDLESQIPQTSEES